MGYIVLGLCPKIFGILGIWRIKLGLGAKGMPIVSGDKWLQLEFKNGRKLLISAQKPTERTKILRKCGCELWQFEHYFKDTTAS